MATEDSTLRVKGVGQGLHMRNPAKPIYCRSVTEDWFWQGQLVGACRIMSVLVALSFMRWKDQGPRQGYGRRGRVPWG